MSDADHHLNRQHKTMTNLQLSLLLIVDTLNTHAALCLTILSSHPVQRCDQ